jgi:pimeloyl-ACP methyl ester carboxylesterase
MTTRRQAPPPRTGRRLTAGVAAVAAAWGCALTGSPAVAAQDARPEIDWHACPDYSDAVLLARGITQDRLPEARALLDRLECGVIEVPLDYANPRGEHISVAVTRLAAEDPEHRLGSLAVNPGGPGGSGYLMPVDLVMSNEASAGLDDRYDLVGFDARGIGYSDTTDCGRQGGGPGAPGPLTEAAARALYDSAVAWNQACSQSDPGFVGELTTENVARDLDRIRRALGERTLNFLGVSWGTKLGTVYRSLFPDRVGRMFLDSVVHPVAGADEVADARAAAAERDFGRFAAWLAARDSVYGLGDTRAEVTAAVAGLVRAYDEAPHRYSDLPMAGDGALVARVAAQDSRAWERAGRALAELRDAAGDADGAAPPTVRALLGAGASLPQLPAGAPEAFNATMRAAAECNEAAERPTFEEAWADYQERLAANPVTGRSGIFSAGCAGWSLPAQPAPVEASRGSLVLSGHRWESAAPYAWTPATRDLVGGRTYTVGDDVHGSAMRTGDCAADVVGYFETGRIDRGCAGSRVP